MLSKIPIFSRLSDCELAAIERHAISRTYPKNTVIINEGDTTDSLYVIQNGKVKVFLSDEHGREVIINSHGPGEYFGELALIDDAERSASVMTLEKSTFSVISKSNFKEVLSAHPEIAINLIKDLTHRVRRLTDNVKSLALLDVYGRVAKTLLSLAHEEEGRLIIEQRLTQQELANRVGASREMVARILKNLESGGYISYDGRHLVIHEKLPSGY